MADAALAPRASLAIVGRRTAVPSAVRSTAGRGERFALFVLIFRVLTGLSIRSPCMNAGVSAHVALYAETAAASFEWTGIRCQRGKRRSISVRRQQCESGYVRFSPVCVFKWI